MCPDEKLNSPQLPTVSYGKMRKLRHSSNFYLQNYQKCNTRSHWWCSIPKDVVKMDEVIL